MPQIVNRMTPKESYDLALHYCECFNKQHKTGDTVWYRPTTYPSPVYETKLRGAAIPYSNPRDDKSDAMTFLEGVCGPVPIFLVMQVDESRRNELNPVPLNHQPSVMGIQAMRLTGRAEGEYKRWLNLCLPGFGSREYLATAADFLEQAAQCLRAAYSELGE